LVADGPQERAVEAPAHTDAEVNCWQRLSGEEDSVF